MKATSDQWIMDVVNHHSSLMSRVEREIEWLDRQAAAEDVFASNAGAAYRVAADHLRAILNGDMPPDWT